MPDTPDPVAPHPLDHAGGFDAGPDDTYTEGDVEPNPEQVAKRVHELRAWLGSAAGREALPAWWDLTVEEQAVAEVIVAKFVTDLVAGDGGWSNRLYAREMHDLIAQLSTGPRWRELDTDAQIVAVEIISHVRGWLSYEGTVLP